MHNKNKKANKQKPTTQQRPPRIVEPSPADEYEDDTPEKLAAKARPLVNDADQAQATAIHNQLIDLLQAAQTAHDTATKEKYVSELHAWAHQLYAIPFWAYYTPDEVHNQLAQLDTMLAELHPSQSIEAHAERLGSQIAFLLEQLHQKHRYAGQGAPKQLILIQAITSGYALFDIPQWEQYVPSHHLPTLLSFQQTIAERQAQLIHQLAAQEADIQYRTHEQAQALRAKLHDVAFVLDQLPQALTDLQTSLAYWQTYAMPIRQNPIVAGALRHTQAFQTLRQQTNHIKRQYEASAADLAALREAIHHQQQAEALRLHQQILSRLV